MCWSKIIFTLPIEYADLQYIFGPAESPAAETHGENSKTPVQPLALWRSCSEKDLARRTQMRLSVFLPLAWITLVSVIQLKWRIPSQILKNSGIDNSLKVNVMLDMVYFGLVETTDFWGMLLLLVIVECNTVGDIASIQKYFRIYFKINDNWKTLYCYCQIFNWHLINWQNLIFNFWKRKFTFTLSKTNWREVLNKYIKVLNCCLINFRNTVINLLQTILCVLILVS